MLRDWHRLFGLLLTDFFTDSPFTVEIERDLSAQQQFLDVVIVRRGAGQMHQRLPDGLDDLVAHNLITFKSHHETLDAWAMKELIGHYVAYRKLVSTTPTDLLDEDRFRLYAVCARFPQSLSGQVAWHERQAGVYDCRWGTDSVRVVVAGQLPREKHNAPLHLFSASPELVGFGSSGYQQRSNFTSQLIWQLFKRFQGEGWVMPYTMADFKREVLEKELKEATPEERRKFFRSLPLEEQRAALESLPADQRRAILDALPAEERLAGLSDAEIRRLLEERSARRPAPRKQRKRK